MIIEKPPTDRIEVRLVGARHQETRSIHKLEQRPVMLAQSRGRGLFQTTRREYQVSPIPDIAFRKITNPRLPVVHDLLPLCRGNTLAAVRIILRLRQYINQPKACCGTMSFHPGDATMGKQSADTISDAA